LNILKRIGLDVPARRTTHQNSDVRVPGALPSTFSGTLKSQIDWGAVDPYLECFPPRLAQ